jgi:hypothetical protein
MVKVGDRIRLSSHKGPDRDGVVTAVTGSMVRVRWPSGDETTVVPAPGTLTVLALSGDQGGEARAGGAWAARRTEGSGQEGSAEEGLTGERREREHGHSPEGRHEEDHDVHEGRCQEDHGRQTSVALSPGLSA